MRTHLEHVGSPRTLSAALAAGAALLLPAAFAAAAPLTNGNFEAATSADNLTTTFPGWTETAAANPGNTAVRATTALSGLTSARLTGTSSQVGTLSQTVDPIGANGNSFYLSFDFAAVNPGGASPSTNDRAFQLLLTGSNGAQINLIVTRGTSANVGSVQVFGPSAFNAIASQADRVNFSTSLDSPVVNNIVLSGTVGGSYTVSTNGNTSGAVNFYQAGTASTPNNFSTVNFTTVNATTVNYVVDNVVLTPEPGSAGLLAGVAAAGFLRRRRRRHRIG